MDETLNKLADQAGTMHGGLGIILDRLATAEHKLADLRGGLAGTAEYESGVLLAVTDDLAQLADYVTDLRARTAPASPDGGTPIEPHDEGTSYCTSIPPHIDCPCSDPAHQSAAGVAHRITGYPGVRTVDVPQTWGMVPGWERVG